MENNIEGKIYSKGAGLSDDTGADRHCPEYPP